MNIPPVAAEIVDKPRRVLWIIRSRQPETEQRIQAAIAEYLRDKGEPAPNIRIDILMKSPPGN